MHHLRTLGKAGHAFVYMDANNILVYRLDANENFYFIECNEDTWCAPKKDVLGNIIGGKDVQHQSKVLRHHDRKSLGVTAVFDSFIDDAHMKGKCRSEIGEILPEYGDSLGRAVHPGDCMSREVLHNGIRSILEKDERSVPKQEVQLGDERFKLVVQKSSDYYDTAGMHCFDSITFLSLSLHSLFPRIIAQLPTGKIQIPVAQKHGQASCRIFNAHQSYKRGDSLEEINDRTCTFKLTEERMAFIETFPNYRTAVAENPTPRTHRKFDQIITEIEDFAAKHGRYATGLLLLYTNGNSRLDRLNS